MAAHQQLEAQTQAEPEMPNPHSQLLKAAEEALAEVSPATCLALLAVLPAAQRQDAAVRRMQAVCRVQLAGRPAASPSWWKLFGLEPETASSADVRRQFKRLAALVHPDKCSLAGSGDAFKSLQAAADCLLQAAAHGSRQERQQAKRARRQRGNSSGRQSAGEAAEGEEEEGEAAADEGEEEEEEFEWDPSGGGFPWWEEWDWPAPPKAAAAGAARGEERQQGQLAACIDKQREEQEDGQQAEERQQTEGQQQHDRRADEQQQQQQQQQQQSEQEQLEGMSLEELRAEVRRRQAALLAPPLDPSGRRVPLQQMQGELRRARSLLAERLAADAAGAAGGGGGFLPG